MHPSAASVYFIFTIVVPFFYFLSPASLIHT